MKRVAIFIDGNNFYYGLRKFYGKDKSLKKFDFKQFCNYLSQDNNLVKIFYYNAKLDVSENMTKYNSQKDFFDNLKLIDNFKLILCRLLKRKLCGTDKHYYVLKEDDIYMAVDMVEGACDNLFDIAVIVSGDGDFVPAVKAVQRKHKIVNNIYFKFNSSWNLRKNCDNSLELKKDILDKFFDGEGKNES